VLKPEPMSIQTTRCDIDELEKMGIRNYSLIVNRLVISKSAFVGNNDNQVDRHLQTLAHIQTQLPYPRHQVSLQNYELKGVKYLLQVVQSTFNGTEDKNSSR
jgi:hypothetical protein